MKISSKISNKFLDFIIISLPLWGCFYSLGPVFFYGFAALTCLYLIDKKPILSNNTNARTLQHIAFIFIIYSGLSMLWSIDTSYSLKVFFSIILVYYACLCNYKISRKILHLLPLFIILGEMILLFEYYSDGYITRIIFKITNHHKPYYMHELNRSISIISLLIWPCIFLIRKRVFKIIFYLFSMWLILILDSLAVCVAAILTSILYIVPYKNHFIKWCLQYSFVLVGIVWPVIAYVILTHYKQDDIFPDSAVHRIYIWEYVINIWLESDLMHKIFGHGLGCTRFMEPSTTMPDGRSLLSIHPHNNYLQILVELGLIGYVLFIMILTKIAKILLDLKDIYAFQIFVCYVVIDFTAYSVWQGWWLGLIPAIYIIHKNIIFKYLNN